jgi:hypothetical protein
MFGRDLVDQMDIVDVLLEIGYAQDPRCRQVVDEGPLEIALVQEVQAAELRQLEVLFGLS